jgi:hypothetical protein
MTRAEIGKMLDGGPLPCEGFFGRPAYGKIFQRVGEERRTVSDKIERARTNNPSHPSIERAQELVTKMDLHLWVCLNEWEPGVRRAS